MMNKFKSSLKNTAIRRYLIRLAIFVSAYLAMILLQPSVTTALYDYKFNLNDSYFVYLPIPMLVIFSYLSWNKIKEISNYRNSPLQTFIFLSLATAFYMMPVKNVIQNYDVNLMIIFSGTMFISYAMLFMAVFNTKFAKHFKYAIFILSLSIFIYAAGQIIIENYWQFLSKIILGGLSLMLPLFTDQFYITSASYDVSVNHFRVFIGPPCAGVNSMATFLILFLITTALIAKTRKLDTFKLFIAAVAGLITIFILNIVRIFLIIIVGGFYSQDLAINLFHEYGSAVFLISLFILYLYKIFPKI